MPASFRKHRNQVCLKLFLICAAILLRGVCGTAGEKAGATMPRFEPAASGGFTFDTGVLRGELRPGGRSLGLMSVIHIPSGVRLDRSNGLLSHYRVFTHGRRYGEGAWDWLSRADLRPDGSVAVTWHATNDRPFSLSARYQWRDAATIDVTTTVVAEENELVGFESFLASYFASAFDQAAVRVAHSPEAGDSAAFLPARESYGTWQMYPRDGSAWSVIDDGRWQIDPHPVDWVRMPALEVPIAYRRDPASGVTCALTSRPEECLAIACPHQTEGHFSIYFSQFGRDFKAGESASSTVRLTVLTTPDDSEIMDKVARFPFLTP